MWILSSPNDGMCKKYFLSSGKHIVGRQKDASISLVHISVSRQHAKIEVGDLIDIHDVQCLTKPAIKLCDLKSSCGTFVNKQKLQVNQDYDLNSGDKIQFGKYGRLFNVEWLPLRICTSQLKDKQKLYSSAKKIGAHIVRQVTNATHLVTSDKVEPTLKVITCISRCVPVVKLAWVIDILAFSSSSKTKLKLKTNLSSAAYSQDTSSVVLSTKMRLPRHQKHSPSYPGDQNLFSYKIQTRRKYLLAGHEIYFLMDQMYSDIARNAGAVVHIQKDMSKQGISNLKNSLNAHKLNKEVVYYVLPDDKNSSQVVECCKIINSYNTVEIVGGQIAEVILKNSNVSEFPWLTNQANNTSTEIERLTTCVNEAVSQTNHCNSIDDIYSSEIFSVSPSQRAADASCTQVATQFTTSSTMGHGDMNMETRRYSVGEGHSVKGNDSTMNKDSAISSTRVCISCSMENTSMRDSLCARCKVSGKPPTNVDNESNVFVREKKSTAVSSVQMKNVIDSRNLSKKLIVNDLVPNHTTSTESNLLNQSENSQEAKTSSSSKFSHLPQTQVVLSSIKNNIKPISDYLTSPLVEVPSDIFHGKAITDVVTDIHKQRKVPDEPSSPKWLTSTGQSQPKTDKVKCKTRFRKKSIEVPSGSAVLNNGSGSGSALMRPPIDTALMKSPCNATNQPKIKHENTVSDENNNTANNIATDAALDASVLLKELSSGEFERNNHVNVNGVRWVSVKSSKSDDGTNHGGAIVIKSKEFINASCEVVVLETLQRGNKTINSNVNKDSDTQYPQRGKRFIKNKVLRCSSPVKWKSGGNSGEVVDDLTRDMQRSRKELQLMDGRRESVAGVRARGNRRLKHSISDSSVNIREIKSKRRKR